MKIVHRKIDFEKDREYVLERHCRINYECETPWKREMGYDDYHAEWFSLKNQINDFYSHMKESAKDERTIAEIIETEAGEIVGYFWVPFICDKESGFCFSDIQDIYIEKEYREIGLATELLKYAEDKARANGTKVIRSGTGVLNTKSVNLHNSLGYYQYRYEFEKLL